ncbi:MAG: hypothetical protein WCA38_12375, partial [Candidatus Acidiferrales bacterium]
YCEWQCDLCVQNGFPIQSQGAKIYPKGVALASTEKAYELQYYLQSSFKSARRIRTAAIDLVAS